GFDLVKCYLCPSFIEGGTARGVSLRVVNSHTDPFRARRGGLRAESEDPFDEALRDRLIRHSFEAQTFPEPILYLAGLRDMRIDPLMWVVLLVEHQKAIEDDDQGVITAEVSRKKRSITATVVRLLAVGSNSKRFLVSKVWESVHGFWLTTWKPWSLPPILLF
nr:hypothetical protein [Tanacetum cinerariifolium]